MTLQKAMTKPLSRYSNNNSNDNYYKIHSNRSYLTNNNEQLEKTVTYRTQFNITSKTYENSY